MMLNKLKGFLKMNTKDEISQETETEAVVLGYIAIYDPDGVPLLSINEKELCLEIREYGLKDTPQKAYDYMVEQIRKTPNRVIQISVTKEIVPKLTFE